MVAEPGGYIALASKGAIRPAGPTSSVRDVRISGA
jgi:hypothetical protein